MRLHTQIQFNADGFILAESAMDFPGATYPPQIMEGSNHFQMRNDSKTKVAVDLIFDFGIDGRPFFRTERR
jgi:hypothetical protein